MSTAATDRLRPKAAPAQLPQPSASPVGPATDELRQLLKQRTSAALPPGALLWGLPPQCDRSAAQRLVATLGKGSISAARRRQVKDIVASWLNQTESDAAAAWQGVLLLQVLPSIEPLLDDASLHQLWQRALELSTMAGKDTWDDDPVRFALLAIETPLLLAGLSGSGGERQRAAALAAWNELATAWLDEQGLPEARYLPALRPVLASWTRCLQREPALLTAERRVAYIGLLRQAIHATSPDGREVFTNEPDASFLECLAAATSRCNDRETAALFADSLSPSKIRGKATQTSCSPSVYSEDRQFGILRSRLTPDSPRLAVTFDEPGCRVEVATDRSLLSGVWSAELTVDGETCVPHEAWEEVCRHEDDEVEYLELETELSPGWRLQRHILLARQEGFAMLADAVLGEREATLAYTSSLPFAAGVQFEPERETHEGWLARGPRRCLALPLALPEWRSDRPLGTLSQESGLLTLTTHARRGCNLFQPLLIPLASSRRNCEYTWRPLTVAQNLEIQPPDAAVAFRVQLGDRQWVVYRALTRGNRTFLGRNLTSELFVGVFHRAGQMDAIMEVE